MPRQSQAASRRGPSDSRDSEDNVENAETSMAATHRSPLSPRQTFKKNSSEQLAGLRSERRGFAQGNNRGAKLPPLQRRRATVGSGIGAYNNRVADVDGLDWNERSGGFRTSAEELDKRVQACLTRARHVNLQTTAASPSAGASMRSRLNQFVSVKVKPDNTFSPACQNNLLRPRSGGPTLPPISSPQSAGRCASDFGLKTQKDLKKPAQIAIGRVTVQDDSVLSPPAKLIRLSKSGNMVRLEDLKYLKDKFNEMDKDNSGVVRFRLLMNTLGGNILSQKLNEVCSGKNGKSAVVQERWIAKAKEGLFTFQDVLELQHPVATPQEIQQMLFAVKKCAPNKFAKMKDNKYLTLERQAASQVFCMIDVGQRGSVSLSELEDYWLEVYPEDNSYDIIKTFDKELQDRLFDGGDMTQEEFYAWHLDLTDNLLAEIAMYNSARAPIDHKSPVDELQKYRQTALGR